MTTPGAIRVLIADDHTLMRQGLHELCEGVGGFLVVGEARNGAEADPVGDALAVVAGAAAHVQGGHARLEAHLRDRGRHATWDVWQFDLAALRVRFIPILQSLNPILSIAIVIDPNPSVERPQKELQKRCGKPGMNSIQNAQGRTEDDVPG